jgi:hypothetical protein
MACPCGKILKVDESAVGRRVRCPACGLSQVVSDGGAFPAQPRAAVATAAPAAPRQRTAATAGGGSGYLLLLLLLLGGGAIAGMLLLVAGVGAYFIFFNKRSPTPAVAGQTTTDKDTGPGGPKTTYAVKLTVPRKVGEVREHNFNGVQDNWTDLPNGLVGVTRDEFRGTVKTLAVDDKGREIKAEVTVKTFKRDKNGFENVLLQPGQFAVLRLNHPAVFVEDKDGRPLIGEGFTQLNLAVNIEVTHNDSCSDDQLFGTKERKAVGDTWPINRELYYRLFTHRLSKEMLPVIGQDAISGTCKLTGTAKVDGLTYLDVDVEIKVALNISRMDDGDLPPLNLYGTGAHKVTFSFRVAADGSTGPLKRAQKIDIDREVSGTNDAGQQVRYKERVKTSYTDEYRYLSGGKAKAGALAPGALAPRMDLRDGRVWVLEWPRLTPPAAVLGRGAAL